MTLTILGTIKFMVCFVILYYYKCKVDWYFKEKHLAQLNFEKKQIKINSKYHHEVKKPKREWE